MLTSRWIPLGVALVTLTVTAPGPAGAQGASGRGAPSGQQGDPVVIERIDRYLATLSPPFSGTILMVVGDRLLVAKGYDLADRSHAVPNGSETVFCLGSITKLFTALLALRLEQDGVVDLDAPAGTYLSELPPDKGRSITLRHLLLHTSGIPHHYLGVPDYLLKVDQLTHTPREYIELFGNVPLAHTPGAQFTYSSPGYFMLAVALERASDKTYSELLDSLVTGPLGMVYTALDNDQTILRGAASGYMMGLEGLVHAPHENESNRLGAGSVVSTAPDLARLLRAIARRDQRLLDVAHWDALLAPHPALNGATTAGRMLRLPAEGGTPPLTILSFGGSSYGFSARADLLLESDAVMVALSNLQDDNTLQTVIDFAGDILLEELGCIPAGSAERAPRLQPPASGIAVSAEELGSATGFYRLPSGALLAIVLQDGALFLQVPGQETNGLLQGFARLRLVPHGEVLYEVQGRPQQRYRFSRSGDDADIVIEVINRDSVTARAYRARVPNIDASAFAGSYESTELQRTAHLSLEHGRLVAHGFLGRDEVALTPLDRGLVGFDGGFLYFHRYADGTIRDFRFVDARLAAGGLGTTFVRR